MYCRYVHIRWNKKNRKFWKRALTQHPRWYCSLSSAGSSGLHMPVRPLILSPPILVRALCSDPAHLLVRAGGSSGSYCAHCTHCAHFLVWPHCCRVDASSHGGGLLSASWGSEIPNQFRWNLDRLFMASIWPHIQNTVATMIGGLGDRWSCTFLCFLFLECTHRLRRVDCCPMHSNTCFGGGCVPLGLFCLGH